MQYVFLHFHYKYYRKANLSKGILLHKFFDYDFFYYSASQTDDKMRCEAKPYRFSGGIPFLTTKDSERESIWQSSNKQTVTSLTSGVITTTRL